MTVKELQNFIKTKLYADVPADKFNELMTAAQSMDLRSFVDTYGDFMVENSKGWVDFAKGAPKTLQERIQAEFGSSDVHNPFKAKSPKEIDEIYQNYFSDDVPRKDFDRNIAVMSDYWEDDKKAREYEAGKYRRTQEVKKWGQEGPLYRGVLTSDYERQRYINEPEKALFGKEAPSFGEAPETRWESLADLGIGAAALGADVGTSFLNMNPLTFGIATVTGPVIRGTRDVLHKVTDSPYQKKGTDIIKDLAQDIRSNAEIEGLANLRQLSRIVKGVSNGPISTVMRNEDSIGDLKKQLDNFPAMTELKDVSNSDLFEMIQKLPSDSPFRQALQPYAKDIYSIDRAGIADEIDRARKQVDLFENPDFREAIKTVANYDLAPTPRLGERQFEQSLLNQPNLTRMQLLGKAALQTAGNIPAKSGGALKALAVAGRDESVPEPGKLTRDWYLKNYTRDWDLGFKPKRKDNDPKWEAYRYYYINKYGKEPPEEE